MHATTAFAARMNQFVVWTFSFPSNRLIAAVREPAVKSLHLLRFVNQSLARDYPATGFPEFDR